MSSEKHITNGKGSSPRNIFSKSWRENYDGVCWSASRWKLLGDSVYTLHASSDSVEINIRPEDLVEIYPGSVPILIRADNSFANKRVQMTNVPTCHIENSGLFKKIT